MYICMRVNTRTLSPNVFQYFDIAEKSNLIKICYYYITLLLHNSGCYNFLKTLAYFQVLLKFVFLLFLKSFQINKYFSWYWFSIFCFTKAFFIFYYFSNSFSCPLFFSGFENPFLLMFFFILYSIFIHYKIPIIFQSFSFQFEHFFCCPLHFI